MPLENSRKIKDALLNAKVALPNAANTVNTPALDLGVARPFPITEKFHVRISADAVGAGANNKNINVRIQDSADNVTFANIAELNQLQLTDNNGAGYPTTPMQVQLPPSTRRYIRATALGEANGGNAANANLQIEQIF